MIEALKHFIKKKGIQGNFYLITNYENDKNFPKYSQFYSYLWFKHDDKKVLLYTESKTGILKDKEYIYSELNSLILSYILKDIETGELWKKIK